MQPEQIKRLIEAGLANCQAFVEGDGAHFTACVVSPIFAGKSRIEKQQIVYDTVKQELLNGTLHALSLKTFTPEEWDKLDPEGDN
jgi:acid stress-induced BolA-like protein IbaG/YrbA